MTTPSTSLRERSKAKRRRAIQLAALRLFAERGYDGATIAEIADAAEVAPRTISMYFPTKLDIALSVSGDVAVRLTQTFRDHPGLNTAEIIDRWMRVEVASMDPELTAAMTLMFETNPGLRAVSSTHIAEAADVGGAALRAETGLGAGDPMLDVVGAAVGAAIVEYLTTALRSAAGPRHHDAFIRYLQAIITAGASI